MIEDSSAKKDAESDQPEPDTSSQGASTDAQNSTDNSDNLRDPNDHTNYRLNLP